jgi:hypothetical protein
MRLLNGFKLFGGLYVFNETGCGSICLPCVAHSAYNKLRVICQDHDCAEPGRARADHNTKIRRAAKQFPTSFNEICRIAESLSTVNGQFRRGSAF